MCLQVATPAEFVRRFGGNKVIERVSRSAVVIRRQHTLGNVARDCPRPCSSVITHLIKSHVMRS